MKIKLDKSSFNQGLEKLKSEYKILAPKGTNIVPILQNSTKPNEAEIIIMPGQKLKIIDISNKKNMTLITIKLINTKK